ncbi:lasso peptide biosynthesis B2 protein [Candidatus Omnitrophota bacterium]
MSASGTIQKFLNYRDWRLLLCVLSTSLKISVLYLLGKNPRLLNLASPQKDKLTNSQDREKIIRYVNLCMFLRKKIGIRDTCFTYSLLLCHVLRRKGIDARVNFGAKKDGERIIGHCWTNQGLEMAIDYQTIFIYP